MGLGVDIEDGSVGLRGRRELRADSSSERPCRCPACFLRRVLGMDLCELHLEGVWALSEGAGDDRAGYHMLDQRDIRNEY